MHNHLNALIGQGTLYWGRPWNGTIKLGISPRDTEPSLRIERKDIQALKRVARDMDRGLDTELNEVLGSLRARGVRLRHFHTGGADAQAMLRNLVRGIGARDLPAVQQSVAAILALLSEAQCSELLYAPTNASPEKVGRRNNLNSLIGQGTSYWGCPLNGMLKLGISPRGTEPELRIERKDIQALKRVARDMDRGLDTELNEVLGSLRAHGVRLRTFHTGGADKKAMLRNLVQGIGARDLTAVQQSVAAILARCVVD